MLQLKNRNTDLLEKVDEQHRTVRMTNFFSYREDEILNKVCDIINNMEVCDIPTSTFEDTVA